MVIELSAYKDMKICVAVSGGRDSMALLHYLYAHSAELGISLSALNCNHNMRANSARDTSFVKEWCADHDVPLLLYESDVPLKTEAEAREWRRSCYFKAMNGVDGNGEKITCGADCVATAHHLNDNAETVLFNLARGSALAGVTGITDAVMTDNNGQKLNLIHPLISVSRSEINSYIDVNNVPYVDDETNFSDAYTRNYMRINVLPTIEKAVPEAAKAIYRFSRIAAEDEKFICGEVQRRKILTMRGETAFIKNCEKPLFSRAAVKAVKEIFKKKNYTSAQIDALCNLASNSNGKKFEFLGLSAYSENGGISIKKTCLDEEIKEVLLTAYICDKSSIYGGQFLKITNDAANYKDKKILRFDVSAIPESAVIRFMKRGDRFTKFGGGTKSLGDFFTDRKIPLRMRNSIPLIADGNEILAVCGVEISEKIKITEATAEVYYIITKIID